MYVDICTLLLQSVQAHATSESDLQLFNSRISLQLTITFSHVTITFIFNIYLFKVDLPFINVQVVPKIRM